MNTEAQVSFTQRQIRRADITIVRNLSPAHVAHKLNTGEFTLEHDGIYDKGRVLIAHVHRVEDAAELYRRDFQPV